MYVYHNNYVDKSLGYIQHLHTLASSLSLAQPLELYPGDTNLATNYALSPLVILRHLTHSLSSQSPQGGTNRETFVSPLINTLTHAQSKPPHSYHL